MANDYINDQLIGKISREQNIRVSQIKAVLQLIGEGATVPFIARYRKEVTGGLDEEQIRAVYKEWDYGQKLAERKEDVLRLIEEKGKLTPEITDAIVKATKLAEIEDIYRPYKEKKKTRATDAKKKGLDPLAEYFLSFPLEGNVEEEASKYVTNIDGMSKDDVDNLKKEGTLVANIKEAIQGAEDIIAEIVSDEPKYRAWIRKYFEENSKLKCTLKEDAVDEKKVYEMYYDYEEPLKTLKLHRVLAINRAESEKVIKVDLVEDYAFVINYIQSDVIKAMDSVTTPYVQAAIEDSYNRLIKQSIVREIRSELKDKAEDQSILIFSENLRNYLLTPPIKGKIVLGVDPAFRHGCKLAAVDPTGKFLGKDIMYPHQGPSGKKASPEEYLDAVQRFKRMVLDYNCEIISIGNGTASRETEAFVNDTLANMKQELEAKGQKVQYVIVSEAGASVYSASELAAQEFPDFHVEERSAVSIARRLQDPLAELVKIDPKSIGVGQYQHDVSQTKLSDSLDFVVSTAVNQVGVNINTASPALLQYVAGLNAGTAKKIVAHRDENGVFTSRADIKVKGVGPKALEQAMGFLRITDGTEPLDMTSIHPESYDGARKILEHLGCTSNDLGSEDLVKKVNALTEDEIKELQTTLGIGEYTIKDILDAFKAPMRDPRDEIQAPILKSDLVSLKDLKVGMELQGTVRNVTDFGAFVDCGVHADGLVHISKMSTGYITRAVDAVHVGQIVKVWVLEVDTVRERLQLTMIDPNAPKVEVKKLDHKHNKPNHKPQDGNKPQEKKPQNAGGNGKPQGQRPNQKGNNSYNKNKNVNNSKPRTTGIFAFGNSSNNGHSGRK